MPSPKHTISDAFRHIRELMRCIVVLEDRIKDMETKVSTLERHNEEYELED